jgi:5'-3' exonuclease
VQVDRMRRREIDEAALIARRGVRPTSIPDLLALTGDDADGVPGLPGFGDKSAAALLAAFGSIERIPDDPRRWPSSVRGAQRLAATLGARRSEALLYRTLTTLRRDVPLAESFDDLAWRGPSAAFEAWCARMDALQLLRTFA